MTATPTPETYQVEDIQEILQLAIARREEESELTRTQLEEIAADLGIPQTDLVVAEETWRSQKIVSRKKQDFNLYRRHILKNKTIRFGIVNSFLLGLNTLDSGQPSWSLYILLIWGLFFSLKSWRLWQTSGENYETEFERWDRKTQLKESVQTLWQKTQRFLSGADFN
ncbi:hypothetical protein Lepto7376_4510 [[Leptolyngbya] sp. PCC 7376]|uniref:2TM domain-containing protein n=1 Tax=[Leptolyngbya] sp. PCC 7376 TaxID=111781 RepID=UPI00029EC513|nr:2TM domain-containing protein [[Leptolyngbya] sp. PCC 7376]AFY40612.1 hypothetical protein Lepto7376_4510 [[Leptolyngbya] sp. PCC 7376]